jgi:PAS domain S-box-containing protein
MRERMGTLGEAPDFRAMFESIPGSFIAYRPDFTVVAITDVCLRAIGRTRDDVIGLSIFDVLSGTAHEAAVRAAAAHATRDFVVWGVDDAPAALIDANRQLRDVNTFLESIFENIPNMVFVKEAEHLRFKRINKAGEELLGLSRDVFLGKNDYDFFPPDQAAFFQSKDRATLEGGTVLEIPDEPIETPRGRRWLHTKKIPLFNEHGVPAYLLGISEDITERKKAAEELTKAHEELEQRVEERTAEVVRANDALLRSEEQLRQAQKMDAVGRLAGGVAHDFNNMLSVVLSYCDIMLVDAGGTSALHENLVEVRKAAQRAAELTRQLLTFSRQRMLEPRVVDLNDVIRGLDKMTRRLIGEDIEIRLVTGPILDKVLVDANQVEQVVVNLIVNARDAMPRGGRLTIETANVNLDDAYCREHFGAKPGAHVMLAISDTGTGMDKATLDRIFEPFFTTKEMGKGTGLGLSTVFGIVQQNGGSIWVTSEPGAGTTFRVYFARTAPGRATEAFALANGTRSRGNESILLVEDNDQVRMVARGVLRRQGYRVLDVGSPIDAIGSAESHPGTIDLLLTDVVMPRMSGPELAKRLKAARPDMRVLFMSGYTDEAILNQGLLDSEAAFLQKPFTPETLGRKVREVLDAYAKPAIDAQKGVAAQGSSGQ